MTLSWSELKNSQIGWIERERNIVADSTSELDNICYIIITLYYTYTVILTLY